MSKKSNITISIVLFLIVLSVLFPIYSEQKTYDNFMQQGDTLFTQGKFLESKKMYFLAVKGRPEAAYKLGELYYYGWGVEKDLEKAYFWYSMSANSGYQLAKSNADKLCKEIEALKFDAVCTD